MARKRPDTRGIGEKISSGGSGLDVTDAVSAAATVADFVPGVGQAVSVPLSGVAANMERARSVEALMMTLRATESRLRMDPVARKAMERLDKDAGNRFGAGVAGALGGAATGAAAGLWLGAPGAMVGSVVGSIGGGMGYGALFADDAIDPRSIIRSIGDDLHLGGKTNDVKVFTLLAAGLPKKNYERLMSRLERETGAKSFDMAVASGHGDKVLKLMESYDPQIQSSLGLMPPEGMTATAMFTDAINRGEVKDLDSLLLLRNRQAAAAMVDIGYDMRSMGIAPVAEDASMPELPEPGTRSGKGQFRNN